MAKILIIDDEHRFLDLMTREGARLVVFDVWFVDPGEDEAEIWSVYPRVWDWLEKIGVTPYDDMPELKQYRLSRHWIEIRPKSVKKAFKTSKRFVA